MLMKSTVDNVRPGYDRWAAVYDHDANPLPALEEPVMQQALGNVQGLTVLDAGCGTGRHSQWLASSGAQVTAIDFSEGMLAAARIKPGLERVNFIEHDLHQRWPFDNNSFDAIISGLVLEHIHSVVPFFAELHRLVKAGGMVALSTLHPSMFLRGSQARFTDPETGTIVQPGSINHSYAELVLAAQNTGFRFRQIIELAPDTAFAHTYPRAEKYLGWPMLLVMVLGRIS
jgi:2-polyprenyl-3-methyl-5-hydroxy-6-metoxy-1,4-benzoquinol methylase